jgi:uncharacterized membrane protein YfcA
MPSPADAILTLVIFLAATLLQGFFGFGFGIAAMAGLTLSHDLVHAAGVVNITGILTTTWMALRLRHHILGKLVLRMLPALVVGVALGVTALQRLDRDLMVSILGVSIVVISIWNLAQPRLRSRESPWLDNAVGLLGGLLSGAFNTGGPPVIIHLYRRPESPEVLKATLQSLFLAMGLARLPMAATQGLLTQSMWVESLLVIPALAAGLAGGIALARYVPPDRFRRTCWIALGLLGVALLVAG